MTTLNIILFIFFLIGQILSAGNMNWQQAEGYREINPLYGKHPSIQTVYIIKIIQTALIYYVLSFVLYNKFTTHDLALVLVLISLIIVNLICWGFIAYDRIKDIPFKMVWR